MIAAVSPADIFFEETLSTLRFVERAKRIQVDAKVNMKQDASAAVIEDLRRQITDLRTRLADVETTSRAGRPLADQSVGGSGDSGDGGPTQAKIDAAVAHELRALRGSLTDRESLITQLSGQLSGIGISDSMRTTGHDRESRRVQDDEDGKVRSAIKCDRAQYSVRAGADLKLE